MSTKITNNRIALRNNYCLKIANSAIKYLSTEKTNVLRRPRDLHEISVENETIFISAACFNGDLESVENIYHKVSDKTNRELEENLVKGFIIAGQQNHMNIVDWFLRNDIIPERLCIQCANTIFKYSCLNGSMTMTKRFQPLISVLMFDLNELFVDVCANGHIDTAQWLYDTFIININYDKGFVRNSNAFEMACLNGHLDIVQWIYSTGEIDYNIENGAAFISACSNGQYNIAVWMIENLKDLNITGGNDYQQEALLFSMINGHIKIAKLLYSTGKFNIHEDEDHFFTLVCSSGHFEVILWFYSLGGFNLKEGKLDRYAFLMACANGQLNIAQWIFYTLGLTIEDISTIGNTSALVVSYQYNHLNVIEWLCSIMNKN